MISSVRAVPAKKIRLMGSAEIAVRLGGVSRARIYQITQRRSFPEPVAALAMGNVWLAEDVEAWIAEHRPEIAEATEGG
jgi:predicted DNA-binding transcriptional regulator AlpA